MISKSGLVALLTLTAGLSTAGLTYRLTDLGTIGGNYSFAWGINSSCQVAGSAFATVSTYHAFLCSGGAMADLGTLGGIQSEARGLNDVGQVVGWSGTATHSHAFLYSGGVMTDLGTLGGATSGASGVSFSLVDGDVNGDNNVNLADLLAISAAWRSTPGSPNWNPKADLNGDGKVNLADWLIVSKSRRQTGDP